MTDPPVRSDGRCARPGCRKRRKMPPRAYVDLGYYEQEPFCSRTCAELYHGVELTVTRTSLGYGPGAQKVYA